MRRIFIVLLTLIPIELLMFLIAILAMARDDFGIGG
jgi:hypothetical protein